MGTTSLLTIIAIAFAVEVARGALGNDAILLSLGALPNSGQVLGQYWRLLSFGLLHASLYHFIVNVAFLLWVGPVVERRVGTFAFLTLFLAASVFSGVAIFFKHVVLPSAGGSVGASGGVFGLLGAALVLVYRIPPANPGIRRALWLTLLGGLVVSFLPGVSMAGHVAGLVVGVPAAFFVRLVPAATLTRAGA
ncbi:MAG: rhomboid family intramembrane serine protease [Thermoanaerobaculia bacterium]